MRLIENHTDVEIFYTSICKDSTILGHVPHPFSVCLLAQREDGTTYKVIAKEK